MNQTKAEAIVTRLMASAEGVRYGHVAACLKLHDGRVVSVTYTANEQTKEWENPKEKEQ